MLKYLNVEHDYYYWVLSISTDTDYQIDLKKRHQVMLSFNNYNSALLKTWHVNTDIQPVNNYSKAVAI